MFFRKKPESSAAAAPEAAIIALLREHLRDADDDQVRLLAALTGLFAAVAYADREYSEAEQAHVREALGQVHGLTAQGVEAICSVLRVHVMKLAVGNPQQHTRVLRELGDVELRREVLDALIDLAAADGELALAETDLLRRTASALGLEASDYTASQARHRDKLKLLK